MDFGKSFTFMFDDKDWITKILVGSLFTVLSAILVGAPFILGYTLEIIRRVVDGREEILPPWEDLGEKFVQGLVLAIIMAIYALPLILLGGCFGGITGGLSEAARSDAGRFFAGLGSVTVGLLTTLLSLIYAIIVPAVTMQYAVTRDFGAAFRFGDIWKIIRANVGYFLLVVILGYVATTLSSLGAILCFVGVFVTGFWATLVQAHLGGQYYREYVHKPMLPAVAPVLDTYLEPTDTDEPVT